MSDQPTRAFDPQGEARSVLQSAVTDFGVQVLSNAVVLEGICEDRLPELPREASLIANASRADVVGMLQQQVGGVGPDVAVQLTARALADSRMIDPAACVWVVGEFARCLGYTVSGGPAPADAVGPGGQEAGRTAQDAVPTSAPASEQPGPTPPSMDAPTVLPVPPPGSDHPVTQRSGSGSESGPSGSAPSESGPSGYGVSPPPWAPPPPPTPPARGKSRGPLLAGAGAVALVVVYLIVAGVASLPPFGGGKASPTPPPVSSPPASTASLSSSPSPPATTSAQQTLRNLIPNAFKTVGSCSVKRTGWPGQTAEITCTDVPHSPSTYVTYYLFSNVTALNKAYAGFLSQYAKTTPGSGNCGNFKTFTPCETIWGPANNNSVIGHVVEYLYKNVPDMTYTVRKDLLIVDTSSAGGNSLVTWWGKLPPHWLSASGWTTADS